MDYGVLCLVPVAVLLIMAIWTRKCASSMLIGCLVGCVIMGGLHFVDTFVDSIYGAGCSEDTVYLVFLLAVIGPAVAFMAHSKGPEALANLAAKKIHSEKSLFLWSWLLALALFIDDMMRSAVLGQLSPIYDRQKVPRASLAYFIDAISTTVTSLTPITSWAIFFQTVFAGFDELKPYGSGFEIYVKTIPYNLYAIIAVIICFLFTIGVIPKLGSMKKAYQRASETGELYSEESRALNPPVEYDEDDQRVNLVDLGIFLFAILLLTVVTIVKGEVLYGFLSVFLVLPIVLMIVKKESWRKLMDVAIEGLRGMSEMLVIIFFVFVFRLIVEELGISDFVIKTCGSIINPSLFPGITFIMCALLVFGTGSTWGITAVYATIAVPLSASMGADPIPVLAAILSGEAFGAHACFYCDFTVYASTCARINNIEHAFTQIPYAVIGGALTAVGFFVIGLLGI